MTQTEFKAAFAANLAKCQWTWDDEYNVTRQYDGASYYLPRKDEFLVKYRTFWAVAKTIAPRSIVELGTHAGSSADAYISASGASYIGYDMFGVHKHPNATEAWNPRAVCEKLFAKRGFRGWELREADLRKLDSIPTADMIVVDAAHDFKNEYLDLMLALSAAPAWIFVDDVKGKEVAEAVAAFKGVAKHGPCFVEWEQYLEYTDGGMVFKMRQ